MGRVVIAVYRPLEGKEERLRELIREHLPILRREGLATDRESVVLRSGNGTLLELFEWRSEQAIEEAHRNPRVLAMWEDFAATCQYGSLSDLDEAKAMFPEFELVDLGSLVPSQSDSEIT